MSLTKTVAMTPMRKEWLRTLAITGRRAWDRMPINNGDRRSVTNRLWRPLIAAGLITADCGQDGPAEVADWHFDITDKGRELVNADFDVDGHGKWKQRIVALLMQGDATSEEIATELYGVADRAHTSLASAHMSHLIKQGVVVKKARMAQDGRPGTKRFLYGLAV